MMTNKYGYEPTDYQQSELRLHTVLSVNKSQLIQVDHLNTSSTEIFKHSQSAVVRAEKAIERCNRLLNKYATFDDQKQIT